MRFTTNDGSSFEIPDEWWNEAGMGSFLRSSDAYKFKKDDDCPDLPISIVPIALISPIIRTVDLDFGGFRRVKMMDVLKGIANNVPLPPVRILPKPPAPKGLLAPDSSYIYTLYDGYHRFQTSIAAGFPNIPVIIAKWGLSAFEE